MLTIPDDELRRWLAEDVPHGDLTTHALGIGNHRGRIRFEARQAMVAACSEEAGRIMAFAGADVIECVPSGTALQTGGLLLAAQGRAATLHAGWKVAQTLLETAGGIAAAAQAIVEAVRQINSEVVVACTRKSLPGTRALSIKAILSGGAIPHRLGLSETILVFAQHRTFTGGASFPTIIDGLRRRVPERRLRSPRCGATARPARRVLSLPPREGSTLRTLPTTRARGRTWSSRRRRIPLARWT